jgi:4-amino-4-deoxy-L-arabinose transferase-like glycosyltransferase
LTARRWLAAIVIAAALLRVVPIWFGLPHPHARPDEETALGHAVAILRGDLNPHFFHWPSFTFYVLAGLLGVASRLCALTGLEPTLTGPQQILIARGFVALAGTMTVVVLFRIGRRVADDLTGLIAASFLAVSILHVRESHFAMTDVLMTLLATLSLALLLHAFDLERAGRGALRWFAAAGIAAGLAASTKYTGATLLAAAAAAQLLLIWQRSRTRPVGSIRTWAPCAVFLCSFGAAFVAGSPYVVLDHRQFVTDFQFDVTHLSEGHVVNLGRGWVYHLTRSLPYGVSLPIFIAAIAGLVPLARHYRSHAIIAGAFAVATYVSLGSGYTVFFRYVLPLVPLVCLSAAVAVRHAAIHVASRAASGGTSRRNPRRVAAVLAGVIAAWGAVNCVWFDALLARPDTRVLAAEWLAAHVTPGDTMFEIENAYAMLDLRRLPVHSWRYDRATESFVGAEGRIPDWLVFHESPLWTYAGIPSPLRRLAADRYDRVQTFAATKGAARSAVYDLQDAFFMPVAGFSTVERPGPTVTIYRRRLSS